MKNSSDTIGNRTRDLPVVAKCFNRLHNLQSKIYFMSPGSEVKIGILKQNKNHIKFERYLPFFIQNKPEFCHIYGCNLKSCHIWVFNLVLYPKKRTSHIDISLMFVLCIIRLSRNDQQFTLIVPLLYSIYLLLHVSAVACHHQGAS
jgi:hypothetical protein